VPYVVATKPNEFAARVNEPVLRKFAATGMVDSVAERWYNRNDLRDREL